jgi:hypothetical protein
MDVVMICTWSGEAVLTNEARIQASFSLTAVGRALHLLDCFHDA